MQRRSPGEQNSVSVVVPHFNSTATLARALDSVAAQTKRVSEVIVVDDGSSADELCRVREIIAAREGVRLLELAENSGPASARNLGWDSASGDWVAFLDSDDAWHPMKTEVQLGALTVLQTVPDFLASTTVQAKDQEAFQATTVPEDLPLQLISIHDILIRNRMSTPSVLVRRDLDVRFRTGRRFSEDYELWLTLAGLGYRALLVELPLTAIFKASYGESGLSSRIWKMIWGEYGAYLGARRRRALTLPQMSFGIAFSTCRAGVRLARIVARRIMPRS